ncbi:hypothetical protein SDC9_163304 [bioreactor metagenome]|uniref:Uncharacterized protein n=1 Tax=bioreactor metagenome TaxID=1076179 RepID=A0A645FNG1_9ZZZZ
MAFSITDSFLIGAPVGKFPEDMPYIPVLIAYLFDVFDPEIGDAHSHTIVKSDTAIIHFGCQSRHATHFFGNRNSIRIHLMNKFITQSKVANGVSILI